MVLWGEIFLKTQKRNNNSYFEDLMNIRRFKILKRNIEGKVYYIVAL